MKRKVPALLVAFGLVLAAASVHVASSADAQATGLQPGTWVGTGTLEGSIDAGRGAIAVSGVLTFTLRVDEKLRIAGQGSWTLRKLGIANLGHGPAAPTVKGWAALAFSGTRSSMSLSGTQYVIGEVAGPGTGMPLRVENELEGYLALTRAGRCKLAGSARLGAGMTLRWSATQKSAACRT